MIEYLNMHGVAEHLGKAFKTIDSYASAGKLCAPDAKIGRFKGWLPATIDEWNSRRPGVRPTAENARWWVLDHNTTVYLGHTEVAERIGVKGRRGIRGYKLPPADAKIGIHLGWLPATIDAWHARRPGRGNRVPNWELPPGLQDEKPLEVADALTRCGQQLTTLDTKRDAVLEEIGDLLRQARKLGADAGLNSALPPMSTAVELTGLPPSALTKLRDTPAGQHA